MVKHQQKIINARLSQSPSFEHNWVASFIQTILSDAQSESIKVTRSHSEEKKHVI